MDRLLLKTSNLGVGNGAHVHSVVTDALGNLTWQQDDGADFNFVIKGNLISKNLGAGGDLSLANVNANNITVAQIATINKIVAANLVIKNANVFASNATSIILGNSVTIGENSATMYLKNASASGNIVVSGNVDAAIVNIGGIDIKARVDNFMRSTKRVYVKESGNDANDGTSWDRAVATIKRAATLALPGNTVYVESGTYVEDIPIRLNPNTAIVGDNLRRTILKPKPGNEKLDFFHVDNLCYLYGLRIVNLRQPGFCAAFPCAIAEVSITGGSVSSIQILYSPTGYTSPPPVLIEAPESSSTSASAVAAIENGIVTGFSVKSGGSGYTSVPAVTIAPPSSSSGVQAVATAVISGGVVTNIVIPVGGGGNGYSVVPGVSIEAPTATEGVRATATAVLGSNGQITGFSILDGGSGYTTFLSRPHVSIPAPVKPFILGSPYIQKCSSITGPFKISDGSLVDPTQAPYNSLPYSLNDIDQVGAGGGCRIDGAVCAQVGDVLYGSVLTVNSPLRSFVADSFTQVNQGGPGHLVINRGYAQFVSCFTTFCSYSYRSVAGGLTNISTSVTDFGNYGLVASGYWPIPIATSVVSQNYRSSAASVTIANGNGGKGYTRAPYVLFDAGETVTARATAELDGDKVTSVTILTGGTYATTPSVTFVQNALEITVSIATPGVVTWPNHGLPIGTSVYLKTTGTLPTGLTQNTVYFVATAGYAANAFQLSATNGGSSLATTGTQSGIHTMFTAAVLTISSPCTVTWPNHGFTADSSVSFVTTGTFPTNIARDVSYYVVQSNLSTHTFEIAASIGGLSINTSGTQSGIFALTSSRAARGTVSISSPSLIRASNLTGRPNNPKPDYGSVAKLGTRWYTVTGAVYVSSGVYDISFYPQVTSANQNDALNFYQASQVTTGQHVTEYVGSGVTYNALPEYGGVPNQASEVLAITPAKVYYGIADQQGSIRIGPYFNVDQLSGTVTLSTDKFNLSGLGSIGPFKRDGNPVGVALKEVSPSVTLISQYTGKADGFTVPTQSAVKAYVDRVSLPIGGTINQALVKFSNDDLFTTWKSVVLSSNIGQPNGVPGTDGFTRIVGDGSIVSNISATNIALGTLNNLRLPAAIGLPGTFFFGFGTGLAALNASNIGSGTIPNARLPATLGLTNTTTFVGNADGLANIPVGNLSSRTGTGNAVLDVSPVVRGNFGIGGAGTYPLDVFGNVRVANVLYMNNQTDTNMICLYANGVTATDKAATNVYGFGMSNANLRYNSGNAHAWYSNATSVMTLSTTGSLAANTFSCSADTLNSLSPGALILRNAGLGSAPTIRFQHTTANTAFLFNNANLFYILRGANDATSPSTINGQWPMYWNLTTNDGVCGGTLSAVGDVTAYASDERLKCNISSIEHSLDKIKTLRGVRFEWRDDTPQSMRGPDIGLIAQDVLRVIPEAVKPAPFDVDECGVSKSGLEYLTIDTGNKIIAVLVEAVKDLSSEIDSLNRRVNELESKNA